MSILLTSTLVSIIFVIPDALSSYFWSRWMAKWKNYPPTEETKVDTQIIQDKLPSAFLSFLKVSSSSTFIMGVVVFICVWITSLIIL
jgi:5-bromo-4-chloroindolyl phosphate hydrolysis protein